MAMRGDVEREKAIRTGRREDEEKGDLFDNGSVE